MVKTEMINNNDTDLLTLTLLDALQARAKENDCGNGATFFRNDVHSLLAL